MKPTCGDCAWFDNDPLRLERIFKGINILSSMYGSTRGDAGLCGRHERFLLPVYSCPDFKPVEKRISKKGDKPLAPF